MEEHDGPLRVAIIVENFLPKIDGSTITISHLLQHLNNTGVEAMLFGPESGMTEYAGAKLFGTYGIPLRVYPGLKINFISPAFLAALRSFRPHVIHLVDPIWLGVQSLAALCALQFISSVIGTGTRWEEEEKGEEMWRVPILTSHHTNLPTYAAVFGYPYFHHRTWAVHAYLHSFARYTLVPSASTAVLLSTKGWGASTSIDGTARGTLRVVGRGVDRDVFSPTLRSDKLRRSWGATGTNDVVVLCVGRLSREKNLGLLVEAFARLESSARARAHLVFVGDGPFRLQLQQLCLEAGVNAVFTGQLTGRALGAAVASGDVLSSPSITETFGQVTLQGMAAGLPVVGLYVEGTADLVVHGVTGLLLDPLSDAEDFAPPASSFPGESLYFPLPAQTEEVGVAYTRGLQGGTKKGPHDSAVDLSLPLPLPRHRGEGANVYPDEEDDQVPDSAISLSGSPNPFTSPSPFTLEGDADADAFALPPAALDFFALTSAPAANANGLGESTANANPVSMRRVGCFRTLSPLLRPKAFEFEAIVEGYAGLIGRLILDPDLRASMGKRAEERSRAFTWEGTSARVVEAYLDARRDASSASPLSHSTFSPSFSPAAHIQATEAAPLLHSAKESPSRASSGWTSALTWAVDLFVVAHALAIATLSHAAYMVPTAADLWWR
ncbi:hypothetical protein C8R47DRAFT_1158654 [Mycena vitilis]|nr:hypothetical protein C8R47DRAFT_1158654 [Mycena vitilis]